MAHIELNQGRIEIQSEYRERELVRTVPGAKWDAEKRVWWTPLSWAACIQLRGVFGTDLTVGPALAAWSQQEAQGRVFPCLELRKAEDGPQGKFDEALYNFQRAGAEFLLTSKAALLADEMGTGKTIQAIAALESADGFPALIVCPNSMKFVWENELRKWCPAAEPVVVTGSAAKRRKALEKIMDGSANVAIINWEALRLHSRVAGFGDMRLEEKEKEPKELNAIPWKTVIADEAHKGKEPRSKMTRALWAVAHAPAVEYRFALTGTPIANSPEDLWSIMHFVSPDEFPAKTKFIERYADLTWNYAGFQEAVGIRSDRKEELFKIIDPRFIRRPKDAVLPFLPQKRYIKRYVEMGSKQKKAYDQMAANMLAELEGGDVVFATNPLTKLIRLLQFASAYGEIQTDEATGEEKLLLTEPSNKVDALMEIAEELGDKPAVVFAESRQLIELAAARMEQAGYKVGLITGSVGDIARQANVDAFQRGDLQFILATMGAGGVGITLTAADTAIYLQRSFNFVNNVQSEDRIHRVGQNADKVDIIDIIARDTIEHDVHAALLEKAGRLEEVARDKEAIAQWLQRR